MHPPARLLSLNPVKTRVKSSLEEGLQGIHEARVQRKNDLSDAMKISFLEMDCNGLCAERKFSNRKMLTYLLDSIGELECSIIKEDEAVDEKNTDDAASSLVKLRNATTLRNRSNRWQRLFGQAASSAKVLPPRRRRGGSLTNAEVLPLQLKDIRRIEYVFNADNQPFILVRRHVVVISFTPIRIIVLANRLLLLTDSQMMDAAMKELFTGQLKDCLDIFRSSCDGSSKMSALSFEFSVYEAVLGAVIEIQKQHLDALEKRIKKVSGVLKQYSIVPVEVNEKVREYMTTVTEMIENIRSQRRAISEILESKDMMALMNLTKLRESPSLYRAPLKPEILSTAEMTEVLLESYLMDFNSIQSRLSLMLSQLQGAEAMVDFRLQHGFNQMLIGDTVLSVMSAAFAVGIFLAGLGGMNFVNGYENERRILFQTTSFIPTLVITIFCIVSILYMQANGILPKSYNKQLDT